MSSYRYSPYIQDHQRRAMVRRREGHCESLPSRPLASTPCSQESRRRCSQNSQRATSSSFETSESSERPPTSSFESTQSTQSHIPRPLEETVQVIYEGEAGTPVIQEHLHRLFNKQEILEHEVNGLQASQLEIRGDLASLIAQQSGYEASHNRASLELAALRIALEQNTAACASSAERLEKTMAGIQKTQDAILTQIQLFVERNLEIRETALQEIRQLGQQVDKTAEPLSRAEKSHAVEGTLSASHPEPVSQSSPVAVSTGSTVSVHADEPIKPDFSLGLRRVGVQALQEGPHLGFDQAHRSGSLHGSGADDQLFGLAAQQTHESSVPRVEQLTSPQALQHHARAGGLMKPTASSTELYQLQNTAWKDGTTQQPIRRTVSPNAERVKTSPVVQGRDARGVELRGAGWIPSRPQSVEQQQYPSLVDRLEKAECVTSANTSGSGQQMCSRSSSGDAKALVREEKETEEGKPWDHRDSVPQEREHSAERPHVIMAYDGIERLFEGDTRGPSVSKETNDEQHGMSLQDELEQSASRADRESEVVLEDDQDEEAQYSRLNAQLQMSDEACVDESDW